MPRSLIHPPNTKLIFLSSVLLALSFPKFNLGFCAWFALVPAFAVILHSKDYRRAFLAFFSIGYFFFIISIEWIRHVCYFGWFFVALIPAIYFGCFGAAAKFFLSRRNYLVSAVALPSLWVVSEFIRTEIPVWGFGWNLLGYSQSNYLPVAQLARFFGAYGVSFLIVLVNYGFYLLWLLLRRQAQLKEMLRPVFFIALAAAGVSFLMATPIKNGEKLSEISASVIQGNIPQEEKWNAAFRSAIIERYQTLSELATANPTDLVIWPEAAWPGLLNKDPEGEKILAFARQRGKAFLIGSLYEDRAAEKIYNSAFLIRPDGLLDGRYDKIRLVPFGEFVPAKAFFNLFGLEKLAYSLGVGDFGEGRDFTVFTLPLNRPKPVHFASLICFEDTFPELARKFVKHGANFLVVITNDAWFGKSAAAYQHLQASVFRAIEEGVPVLRAANTGVSGFISPRGEVLGTVRDQHRNDTWVTGGLTMSFPITFSKTFYQRFGYLFPLACLVFLAFTFVVTISRRRAESM